LNTDTTTLPVLSSGTSSIPTSIFKFAFCRRIDSRDPTKNKTFEDFIEELYTLASPENWGDALTKEHPILHNYIHHTVNSHFISSQIPLEFSNSSGIVYILL
jgi:hypothetical protein